MNQPDGVRPSALIRDFILLHVKLVLDGVLGLAILWLSWPAAIADLVFLSRKDRGRYFYGLLRFGERVDLWLNLYGPARNAEHNRDGMFGESRAGDHTYVGRMEEWFRGHTEAPAAPRS